MSQDPLTLECLLHSIHSSCTYTFKIRPAELLISENYSRINVCREEDNAREYLSQGGYNHMQHGNL